MDGLDKKSWYDGAFYARFFDPVSGTAFARHVAGMIEDGASVVDLACGTGAFIRGVAGKCAAAAGIDLSSRMIAHARKQATMAGGVPVDFIHGSAADASHLLSRRFDYAVMTQFLHEIGPDVRDRVMIEAAKVAGAFFIADFVSPFPKGASSLFLRIVERAAGREHYRNFKDWMSGGGIDGFLERHGLAVEAERLLHPGTIKLVKARPVNA